MVTELEEPRSRAVAHLAELARTKLVGDEEPRVEAASLARAAERAFGRSRRRWRPVWLGLAVSAAVAGVTAIAVVPRRHEPAPWSLSFVDERAHADAAGRVAFSDGSSFELAAGTQARVRRAADRRVEVELTGGNARAIVRRDADVRWTIRAGPFALHVAGARFALRWNNEVGHLDVAIEEGSLVVAGASGEEVAMRAGQHLQATSDGVFRLEPNVPGRDDAPRSHEGASDPSTPAPSRVRRTQAFAPGWSERLGRREFAAIVADARRHGAHAITRTSRDDLAALADAARYVGDFALAERALLATRRRFPRDSSAAASAFLLGRLAEDQRSDLRSALRWYDAYLREAPAGSYAAEALGRRLLALRAVLGDRGAQDAAAEYLRRFPNGPYAEAARKLHSGPAAAR